MKLNIEGTGAYKNTERWYTHAVVAIGTVPGASMLIAWCGSRELAEKALKRFEGRQKAGIEAAGWQPEIRRVQRVYK